MRFLHHQAYGALSTNLLAHVQEEDEDDDEGEEGDAGEAENGGAEDGDEDEEEDDDDAEEGGGGEDDGVTCLLFFDTISSTSLYEAGSACKKFGTQLLALRLGFATFQSREIL